MSHKLITEFVGTLFLVLIIGMTQGMTFPAAIPIGVGLMVLVYMGGHVSGAQYNPAVTLAVALRGAMPWKHVAPYMIVQVIAATIGALMATQIKGTFMPTPSDLTDVRNALAVEFIFTYLLALVVLNVATAKATHGNSYFGVAIGCTVMAAAFVGGPISGGAFNPAVGLGPALASVIHGKGFPVHVWIYIAAPLLGAALAAFTYRAQNGRD